jgi:hypothetical protein
VLLQRRWRRGDSSRADDGDALATALHGLQLPARDGTAAAAAAMVHRPWRRTGSLAACVRRALWHAEPGALPRGRWRSPHAAAAARTTTATHVSTTATVMAALDRHASTQQAACVRGGGRCALRRLCAAVVSPAGRWRPGRTCARRRAQQAATPCAALADAGCRLVAAVWRQCAGSRLEHGAAGCRLRHGGADRGGRRCSLPCADTRRMAGRGALLTSASSTAAGLRSVRRRGASTGVTPPSSPCRRRHRVGAAVLGSSRPRRLAAAALRRGHPPPFLPR